MKNHLLCIAFILVLAGTPSLKAAPLAIQFEGNSTLHRFSGTAESDAVEIKNGASGQQTLVATIAVTSLNTGHEGRDEKMRAMFGAGDFPEIRGSADLAAMLDPQTEHLPIELAIRGQTRTVEARKHVDTADPASPVRLDWTVSLSSFGLSAPTVIGLIRVYDEVQVTAVFSPDAWRTHTTPPTEQN